MNIVQDKKFIKLVEDFVFTNDKKYIISIARQKTKIPASFRTSSAALYRGMILPQEIVDDMKSGGKFVLDDFSSWTSNLKIAKSFVIDPKKRIKNVKGVGVIFKKRIPPVKIILNIQSLILFLDAMGTLDEFNFDELNKEMAIEEAEYICDKKLSISKTDISQLIKI